MSKNIKNIIITLLILIIAIFVFVMVKNYMANKKTYDWLHQEYYSGQDNMKIISDRIDVKLPNELILIEEYKNLNNETFMFKFNILDEYLDSIKNELELKISQSYYINNDKDSESLPYFQNIIQRFKLNKNEIKVYYTSFWTVRKDGYKTSHQIYAFICEEDNKHYLYLFF